MSRFILTILLFTLILFTPFWLYLPALLLAVIYQPFYYEAIFLGFLVDVLYGLQANGKISFYFPFAIMALVAIFLSIPVRERIRWHA